MERLTQILFVLSRSPGRTATTERLLEHVGYGSDKTEDRRRQLLRDIRHLTELGWEISPVGAEGEAGRYRLVAGDLRLRVDFSAEEQAELQRAARAAELSDASGGAGPGDGASPADRGTFAVRPQQVEQLDGVQRAVQARCRLAFDYRGSRREVHPHRVHLRAGGWYLRARPVDGDEVKTFRVDRMTGLVLADPGTADVPPVDTHLSIDPVAWQVDPPLVAVVATTEEHVPQVRSMLGGGARATADDDHDGAAPDEVVLRVPVTHRSAFRGRLLELGSRVRLLGPDELRDEVRRHLLAVVGGGA